MLPWKWNIEQCGNVPLADPGSKRLFAASGRRVAHYGSIVLVWRFGLAEMTAQFEVADVRRPLFSLAKLLQDGQRMSLESATMFVELRDGRRIPVQMRRSVLLWKGPLIRAKPCSRYTVEPLEEAQAEVEQPPASTA